MNSKDKFITPKQYAQAAGLSVAKVTQMLRDGQLTGEKVGNRWQIPVEATPGAAEAAAASTASPPSDRAPAPSQGFTVQAFAEMTYLTVQGVEKWLREGRLAGARNAAGQWYVDAANLERPDVRRLLRNG